MIREMLLGAIFPDGIPPHQYANLGALEICILELEDVLDQINSTDRKHDLKNVDTPRLKNDHNVSAKPYITGTYPANFEESPIELAQNRNKYGRYDQDVPPEIDAEIIRLRDEGRDCRGIASELERLHGVHMHYRRVQGRLSVFGRKHRHEVVAEGVNAQKDVAESPHFSEKIDERILELEFNDQTPEEISQELQKDGAMISPEQVAVRLEELHVVVGA